MKQILVGIVAVLLFPTTVFGATFAKETLFLSKPSVTEGETVLVHAIVSNDANAKFTGKLEISDKETSLGSVPVSLALGEASVVSVSWKPQAGTHTLTATLKDSAGTAIEKESATFSIQVKKETPAVDAFATDTPASVDSSADIQKAIENISPAVAKTSAPVFSTIDSARESAAEVLDQGVAWSKKQLGTSALQNKGTILGAETEQSAPQKIGSSLWTVAATLLLYVFSLLRYIVGSAGVCYPILALLFLFVMWKGWRRWRRRR